MRRVYTPPPDRGNPIWPIFGAALLTLGVFLVLPLTQMASSGFQKTLLLSKVDTARLEAPPEEAEPPPPPPPQEKEEEPPPPQLGDTPPPMNLNIDLDIAVGSGGAMVMNFGAAVGDEGESLLDTFDVADLEKKPEVISRVDPRYPADLQKNRVEGRVTIVFVLDENGRVEDPRVENSSRPEFEKPALDALRKWRFRPGMKAGAAVRSYVRQTMRFTIPS